MTQTVQCRIRPLYVHLEPEHVFLDVGIWHPGSAALSAMRCRPAKRAGSRRSRPSSQIWKLGEGEALKRAPACYDADHPLIEDIRRSCAIFSPLTQRQATASGFLDGREARAAQARPFMVFVCAAPGVEY